MLILTIRTDKPDAELAVYDDTTQLAAETWQAHRQLAETIHSKIRDLLHSQEKSVHDLAGVVAFRGPGSFTGLRIGLSVANAFANALDIPIVASQGDEWQIQGVRRLMNGEQDTAALPEYGAPVHITQQKH